MPTGDDVTSPVREREDEDTLAASGTLAGEHHPIGGRLGRFVLLEEIGEGGMGRVVRAYDTRLCREVAIKLLRTRGGQAISRVLREAQALAQLSHPNIVAIYDVGQAAGEVFIAMEYVEGLTLRAWLTGSRSRRDVLAVFCAAGRGLAAAHERGVVHRDFKPDNVLVGSDGRVRVVDFGLARTTGPATPSRDGEPVVRSDDGMPALSDDLTEAGTVMGTPGYMAPEQHEGLAATAQSDQYAFCVALWEAVHGARPFGGTILELAHSKREGPPQESARAEVPRWLHAAIVRGLAPAPALRWPAMLDLVTELERGQGRTRTRRRIAVGALAAACIAGIVGAGEIGRRRRAAACEQEADDGAQALWNAELAQRVHDGFVASGAPFAEDMAARVGDWLERAVAGWRDVHAEACMAGRVHQRWDAETIDRATWCIDERALEITALVEELQHPDVRGVTRAVQSVAELPLPTACLDVAALARAPAPAPEERETAHELRTELARAWVLGLAGSPEQALERTRSVLARAETLGSHALRADAALRIAVLLQRVGEYEDGLRMAEDAFFLAGAAGLVDQQAAAASQATALAGHSLGRPEDGRRWARHAELALAEMGETNGLLRADYLDAVGKLEIDAGRSDAAAELYREALELREQSLGTEHPAVAAALVNLGVAYGRSGDPDDAAELFERALAIEEAIYGPEHVFVAETLNNLAATRYEKGEYDAARALHARVVAIRERALGPEHPQTASALVNLSILLGAIGQSAEAEPIARRGLAIQERALGPEHRDVAASLENLGVILVRLDRADEATRLLERAIAIHERTFGPQSASLAGALAHLALAKERSGDPDGALALYERATAMYEATLGPDHPDLAFSLNNLGYLVAQRGDWPRARALQERALVLREARVGPRHPALSWTLLQLSRIATRQGRAVQAVDYASRATQLRDEAGASIEDRIQARGVLLTALELAGETTRAEAVVQELAALGRGE